MPHSTRPGNPRQYQRHNAEIKGGYAIHQSEWEDTWIKWVGSVWYDAQGKVAITHPEDTFTDMIGWNIEAFLVWCVAKGYRPDPLVSPSIYPEYGS